MPELVTVLARRLRAARAIAGMKVRQVADETGWHPERIYRFERGAQVPDALDLAALSQLYEQPIAFFYGTTPFDGDGSRTLSDPSAVVKEASVSTAANPLPLERSHAIENDEHTVRS